MQPSLKRKLVIGAGVLAAAAFGGGAYAATNASSSNPRQQFLNDAAGRLHVSPAQLENALKAAFADQLDQAVKDGRLTRAQANAIKQRIANRRLPPLGPGPLGRHRGFFFAPGPGFGGPGAPHPGGRMDAAARYLGLTDAQLLKQLAGAKSLAQIAADQNKSVSGLKDALTAAVKARLDKAVAAKMITSAQEQKILGRLSSRLDQIINRKGLGPAFGMRHRGMFFGRMHPGMGGAGAGRAYPAMPLPPGGPGGPGASGGAGAPGGPPPVVY